MKIGDVKKIGVLGLGVMGGGISQTAIVAGYKVVARDLKDEILVRAKENIVSGRFGLKGAVERGKITPAQMDAAIANLHLTTKVEDLANCDIIIEAIGGGPTGEMENKSIKLKV
ncbi:MAG: 3-hydroxyacyl-CoA dehydrogenase NAD-binding domain-containing protein, partial [Dehalococcoidales bacterium]|nr:3-hydroxyacyl-CoA dehydrogenase NAD-binding domain-containing protein [Dehalococcoidales bacterium]